MFIEFFDDITHFLWEDVTDRVQIIGLQVGYDCRIDVMKYKYLNKTLSKEGSFLPTACLLRSRGIKSGCLRDHGEYMLHMVSWLSFSKIEINTVGLLSCNSRPEGWTALRNAVCVEGGKCLIKCTT